MWQAGAQRDCPTNPSVRATSVVGPAKFRVQPTMIHSTYCAGGLVPSKACPALPQGNALVALGDAVERDNCPRDPELEPDPRDRDRGELEPDQRTAYHPAFRNACFVDVEDAWPRGAGENCAQSTCGTGARNGPGNTNAQSAQTCMMRILETLQNVETQEGPTPTRSHINGNTEFVGEGGGAQKSSQSMKEMFLKFAFHPRALGHRLCKGHLQHQQHCRGSGGLMRARP